MIRVGTPADLSQITHVRTSVIENHLSIEQMAERGITHVSITTLMQTGDLGCWVAEADGRVVAFSMADKRDGNIFALFTLPEHEKKGFGTQLLRCCESWLKDQGLKEARLDTGRASKAVGFYVRQGWKEAGDSDFATDDILLKKRL